MRKLTITAMGLAALAVSGCALTSAGVSPGDERNFARSLNDINAERAIKARLNRAEGFDLDGVDVEVEQGIVVLTGYTHTQEDRVEAERIAWSASDVDQVGNEISMNGKKGWFRSAKDSVIQNTIKTRMTADKTVKSRNINIETEAGVVYLLGVARTPQELERAAYIASTTKGAKEVISYIKIPDNMLQDASYTAPPTSNPLESQEYTQPNYAPTQRALPDSLSLTPEGGAGGQADLGAPADNEPYYRDPKTGKRIFLPPGTKTVPYNPGAATGGAPSAPHYVDPETGQQIPIKYFRYE